MWLTVFVILYVAALVTTIAHIVNQSKYPLWLPVLLIAIALCLSVIPRGNTSTSTNTHTSYSRSA